MPRALLSVYDKTGLLELAGSLAGQGWDLIASGGTAAVLRAAGLAVVEVAEVTGFPELLGGRVKTLHPAIHAAILATSLPYHLSELASHGLTPIDLVVCNLYPFAETAARSGATLEEAIEQIDIGGVALLRAAAKNHARVSVLCRAADYGPFMAELSVGPISLTTRKRLAYEAFSLTAAYDAAIRDYLAGCVDATGDENVAAGGAFPPTLQLSLQLSQPLRYGENPHQQAALYNFAAVEGPLGGQLLHGKPLSYNNLLDLDAAWQAVRDFTEPAIAIIKHTNPCGLAVAGTQAEACALALAGDPQAAFGGILAANQMLEGATAEAIGSLFLECIVAPGFAQDAMEHLSRRHNIRLLALPGDSGPAGGGEQNGTAGPRSSPAMTGWETRSVRGGLLLQEADHRQEDESGWQVVTQRAPGEGEWPSLRFAWAAARYLKSNAIALVQGQTLVGAGAGQMSRVDAVHMAVYKAGQRARGAVMGSDAFFPFPDGVELAAAAGVSAIIQPGGSVRDGEVIAAADRLGLAMVFTHRRHFRH